MARDIGKRTHLLHRQTADRDRDTDVIQAWLALRMNANVPGAIDRMARFAFFGGNRISGKGKPLFGFRDEPLDAPSVDQVLQPRLLPISAITVFIEDTNHGGGNSYRLFRTQQQAAIGGELFVPVIPQSRTRK